MKIVNLPDPFMGLATSATRSFAGVIPIPKFDSKCENADFNLSGYQPILRKVTYNRCHPKS